VNVPSCPLFFIYTFLNFSIAGGVTGVLAPSASRRTECRPSPKVGQLQGAALAVVGEGGVVPLVKPAQGVGQVVGQGVVVEGVVVLGAALVGKGVVG